MMSGPNLCQADAATPIVSQLLQQKAIVDMISDEGSIRAVARATPHFAARVLLRRNPTAPVVTEEREKVSQARRGEIG